MLNLNKHTKMKSKPKRTCKFKKVVHMCGRIVVRNCHAQHKLVQKITRIMN